MQSTFILSLLASAVSAQYGSNPNPPAKSSSSSSSTPAKPAVTPCSSSIHATALPSMIYSAEYSVTIPVEINTEIGVDQPAPSASVYVPASLKFDAEHALAFTTSSEVPNPTIGPLSSSTPCSSKAITTQAPSLSYTAFFSTTIPVEISTAISISIGIDQPAPSASVYIPASESFNSKTALAFTSSTEVPNPTIGPLSSSTPCSSKIASTPASKPTITVLPPTVPKVSSKPEGKPTITVLPSQSSAPKPKTTPCTKSTSIITVFPPGATPTVPAAQKPSTLCTKTKGKPTITVFPPGATPNVPAPQQPSPPTGKPAPPSSSTPAGQTNGGPGYGPGRPRYSAWHAAPKPHPSAAPAKVSSKPCTLQTRVRPSATPAAGGY